MFRKQSRIMVSSFQIQRKRNNYNTCASSSLNNHHQHVLPSSSVTKYRSICSNSNNNNNQLSESILAKRNSRTRLMNASNKGDNAVSEKGSIDQQKIFNLSTIERTELESLIVDILGHPKYRVDQIWNWIRVQGITVPEKMMNIPQKLRNQLSEYTKPSSLELVLELKSKDGTIKRAYKCFDGQIIESVLMPYDTGRYTACISSQAGCAQGCVFCATGQMGFSRQLTSDEIFEQVARFAAELQQTTSTKDNNNESDGMKQQPARLSNVVFMGMGEPLANYRNVVHAVNRITNDIGIGARKITISTVGIVPNIRKLTNDPNMPQIRLAVSLHCASDKERSALLPANSRFGGLYELIDSLYQYIEKTGRRVTFEWALIEGKNDTPDIARQLGRLLTQGGDDKMFPKLRRDMVHVNVIPLNPTSQYNGSPSQRSRVNLFIDTLQNEFGIACTPRVRRGIDIDAGCGQLKSKVLSRDQRDENSSSMNDDSTVVVDQESSRDVIPGSRDTMMTISTAKVGVALPPVVGVYDDDEIEVDDDSNGPDNTNGAFSTADLKTTIILPKQQAKEVVASTTYSLGIEAVDVEAGDYEQPEYSNDYELSETQRLIALVKGTTINMSSDGKNSKR